MAQAKTPQEKIKAYEATGYSAGVGYDSLLLRIGQYSPEVALRYKDPDVDCALFITAFNPLYQSGDEGWDACDEILHDVHIETDGRSMEIAESMEDLPH